MGVVPEDEADISGVVPAVEVLGLGEVRVAPQEDLAKAGPAAQATALSK